MDTYSKTSNKFISFALCLLMIITIFNGLGAQTVSAETLPGIAIGDFKYTVDTETKTASVTHYTGSALTGTGELIIPQTVVYSSDTYTVTAIGGGTTTGGLNLNGAAGTTNATIRDSIKSIVLPSTITTIGDNGFRALGIESVSIPDSVTSIGANAFNGCAELKSVTTTTESLLDTIGNSAFQNCTSLLSFTVPPKVTALPLSTLNGCSELKSVNIHKNVTSLGNGVFNNCAKLTSVTIEPDSNITTMGNNAFMNTGLTSFTVPSGVTTISQNLFLNSSSLKSVVIHDNVTTIGVSVFSGCSELESVKLSNKITSIPQSLFLNCESLIEVTIPANVESIGNTAFSGCSSLEEIVIPNKVSTMGNGVFTGCSSLTEVIIPNSVTTVGTGMFQNCSELASVTMSDNVKIFSASLFSGCEKLAELNFPSDLTTVNGNVFSGTAFTEINLPNTVTTIAASALQQIKIKTFEFPSSVKAISDSMFGSTMTSASSTFSSVLEEVVFPAGITSIGSYIFGQCRLMERVYFLGVPPITFNDNAFAFGYDEDLAWTTRFHYVDDLTLYYNLLHKDAWEVASIPNFDGPDPSNPSEYRFPFVPVYFDLNDGSEPERVFANGRPSDKKVFVSAPSNPTRTGYTFEGWYSDEECENAFNVANEVTADDLEEVTGNLTVYAKWEVASVGETDILSVTLGRNYIKFAEVDLGGNAGASLIAASYDSTGKLLTMKPVPVTSANAEKVEINFAIPVNGYVKMFLWNSLETMDPLTAPWTTKIEWAE